jgi:hypothetical protein
MMPSEAVPLVSLANKKPDIEITSTDSSVADSSGMFLYRRKRKCKNGKGRKPATPVVVYLSTSSSECSTSKTTEASSALAASTTAVQVEPNTSVATSEASSEPSLSSTAVQVELSTSAATSEASSEPSLSSTVDQVESSTSTANTEATSEPSTSSTADQVESSTSAFTSEATSTITESVASTSTEETTPTLSPVKCRVLVILDKSYSDLHGAGAVDLFKWSIDLAEESFEQDLGFGFDVTYLVDKTNSIIGDDQTKMANFVALRDRLSASTDPALADYGDFCTHIVVTSRKLRSGSSGVGGGPPCSKAALALVSDVEGTHGKFLIRTTTAHEIGHVFGADHVCFLFI